MRALLFALVLASGAPAFAQGPPPEVSPRSLQVGMADLRLATVVRLALIEDRRTRTLDAEVVARDGVVTVAGVDDSAYQAVVAEIASGLPGVRGLLGLGASGLNARTSGDGPATQPLAIPSTTQEAPPARPAAPRVHVVQRGDTLYGIAREYDTTLDELVRINDLRSTSIRIGQRLRVR